MKTWIALFRGINVGGNNILPMKELVRELEAMDFRNVRTYIQSGNVAFQTLRNDKRRIAADITERFESNHGFRPQIFVMSQEHLLQAMKANPYPKAIDDPKSLHLSFLESTPKSPDIKSLSNAKHETESFKLIKDVFFLHAPLGIGRSRLAANVEKYLGVKATGRNWRTVEKLVELSDEIRNNG